MPKTHAVLSFLMAKIHSCSKSCGKLSQSASMTHSTLLYLQEIRDSHEMIPTMSPRGWVSHSLCFSCCSNTSSWSVSATTIHRGGHLMRFWRAWYELSAAFKASRSDKHYAAVANSFTMRQDSSSTRQRTKSTYQGECSHNRTRRTNKETEHNKHGLQHNRKQHMYNRLTPRVAQHGGRHKFVYQHL